MTGGVSVVLDVGSVALVRHGTRELSVDFSGADVSRAVLVDPRIRHALAWVVDEQPHGSKLTWLETAQALETHGINIAQLLTPRPRS
jgi:hypothetical protein